MPDSNSFEPLNLSISLLALVFSVWAIFLSNRTRKADSFAKLYDEFNTPTFGAEMEHIGEWIRSLSTKMQGEIKEEHVRLAYRHHLESIKVAVGNTKNDPLESARRTVKAWFIKCLLFHDARDLSTNHLQALITRDRAGLMLRVFAMTREQTDVWKGLSHDPTSKNSSDEAYFARLEQIAQRL